MSVTLFCAGVLRSAPRSIDAYKNSRTDISRSCCVVAVASAEILPRPTHARGKAAFLFQRYRALDHIRIPSNDVRLVRLLCFLQLFPTRLAHLPARRNVPRSLLVARCACVPPPDHASAASNRAYGEVTNPAEAPVDTKFVNVKHTLKNALGQRP